MISLHLILGTQVVHTIGVYARRLLHPAGRSSAHSRGSGARDTPILPGAHSVPQQHHGGKLEGSGAPPRQATLGVWTTGMDSASDCSRVGLYSGFTRRSVVCVEQMWTLLTQAPPKALRARQCKACAHCMQVRENTFCTDQEAQTKQPRP